MMQDRVVWREGVRMNVDKASNLLMRKGKVGSVLAHPRLVGCPLSRCASELKTLVFPSNLHYDSDPALEHNGRILGCL